VWSTSKLVERSEGHWRNQSTLWLGDADGARAHSLGAGKLPRISPDGRWVAFSRNADVYAVSSAGGRAWLVARNVVPGPWSPTSRYLVTESNEALYATDVETRRRVTIDRGATIYGASFSPSGEEVVWARKRGNGYLVEGGVDLFRARVDGTGTTRLTRGGKSAGPVWGPKRIAFGRVRRSGNVHIPISELWTMRPRGDGFRRLARGNHVPIEWSADGRHLLTSTVSASRMTSSALDVETGTIRTLVRGRNVFALALSRDGRFALVWIHRNLVRVSWDGRSQTVLARNVDELADWNL
jgi:Tol biopolymer transport system component